MTDPKFISQIHGEKLIDDFTKLDGSIRFFGFVRAILMKLDAGDVLDFGAGRGGFWHDDPSVYRKDIRDLRQGALTVTTCDIDDAVLAHPCSHRQVVVAPGKPLPFHSNSFDVIVSDMTFEHIEDAGAVSHELLRVLKPGGWICARTPNRYGYVTLVSRLVPNRLHSGMLRKVQPGRKAKDVFDAHYRMNSPGDVRKLFRGCRVIHYFDNAEPAYFFQNYWFYRLLLFAHKIMPDMLSTTVCFFIRKPDETTGDKEDS